MSDLLLVPILSLPEAAVVNVYDQVPIVQFGVTKRTSAQNLPGAAGVSQLVSDSVDTAVATLPAGKILAKFAIKSTVSFTLAVSAGTLGAANVLSDEPIEANVPRLFTVDIFDWSNSLSVYFEGLTGIVEIKIFLMG